MSPREFNFLLELFRPLTDSPLEVLSSPLLCSYQNSKKREYNCMCCCLPPARCHTLGLSGQQETSCSRADHESGRLCGSAICRPSSRRKPLSSATAAGATPAKETQTPRKQLQRGAAACTPSAADLFELVRHRRNLSRQKQVS